MLTGSGIVDLVNLLNRRGVCLYHSCQYADFVSYLEIGGVPSRALLERAGSTFTGFVTDNQDRENGVWERVFLNPEDFGNFFASGDPWTPTVYGPIQIEMSSDVLLNVEDVAWTPRSAGASDFRLTEESIDDIRIIDSFFVHRPSEPDVLSRMIKRSDQIRDTLSNPKARRPEINCRIRGQAISKAHWQRIIVDSLPLGQEWLIDRTKRDVSQDGIVLSIVTRDYDFGQEDILWDIAEAIGSGCTTLMTVYQYPHLQEFSRVYLRRIKRGNLEWQFDRFAKYLFQGTLDRAAMEEQQPKAQEHR